MYISYNFIWLRFLNEDIIFETFISHKFELSTEKVLNYSTINIFIFIFVYRLAYEWGGETVK
jgi:hypothetical protein